MDKTMATRGNIEEGVLAIADDHCIDSSMAGKISTETALDTILADSLEVIEMTISLEQKFGIDIDDSKIEKCTTVNDVINLIIETMHA